MACCKVCCGCQDCGEGQEGKCCCGETCCQEGEYCCSGECQAEPCAGCAPCECEPNLPSDDDPAAYDWAEQFDYCVMDADDPYSCGLGVSEWLGMGGDTDMFWDEAAVASADGCTILAQIALYDYGSGIDQYVKLWKCTGGSWVNVTNQIAYATEYRNGWMFNGGDGTETPPFGAPACDSPP